MRVSNRMGLVLSGIILLSGCRTATRVRDIPRVDLELSGSGNRGYLLGTPPAPGGFKTTRQIVETDVELPSYYKPKPSTAASAGQAGLGAQSQSPVSVNADGPISVSQASSGPMDTYVVQKGDTLSGIAAKPEIYGKASKWKRILDANYALLKGNPNHIQAGMKLDIPRGEEAVESGLSGKDSGTVFQK